MIGGDGVGEFLRLRKLVRFAMILLLPVARPLDLTFVAYRATGIFWEVRYIMHGIVLSAMDLLLFFRRGVSARWGRGVCMSFWFGISRSVSARYLPRELKLKGLSRGD